MEAPFGQEKAWQYFTQTYQEGRLPHALILHGAMGVGKLWFAHHIAALLNCEQPSSNLSPCGTCSSCQKVFKGIHPDMHYVLPIISKVQAGKQATSDDFIEHFRKHFFHNPYLSLHQWAQILEGENKQLGIFIHDIRELKRKLNLKAFEQKYKVVILWYAEKINTEGANAFLKLLEEPSEKTLILLCVSDTSQILPTIRSRCQVLPLQKIPVPLIQQYLEKHYEIQQQHAHELALLAEGSLAKAIDIAQDTNQAFSELFIEWMRLCYEGALESLQTWTEKISKNTRETQKLFLDFALQKLRDALLFQNQLSHLSTATPSETNFLQKFSQALSPNKIEKIAIEINNAHHYITRNANPTLTFMALSIMINAFLKGTQRYLTL